MDSDGWKRLLCSKQFGKKTDELCDAIAMMARRISTSHVDPKLTKSFVACRLIPLDKKPGVRPVGIGEVLRRIIGKAVMTILKKDVVSATAPVQVCAGLPGGVEAAVHAARKVFEDSETEALILVDAENAFNALNRKAALSNVRIVCPELSTYLINSYREPARLFIARSDQEILSEEGVTQGDNAAMGFYACATVPVILSTMHKQISTSSEDDSEVPPSSNEDPVKQIWYADDAAGGGKIKGLASWWKDLCSYGPMFGYFPKPSKTWVIVKPGYEEQAKEAFPGLQVTSVGQRYLGSFIGSDEGKNQFIREKVNDWCRDLKQLSDIATREPQIAYSAFVFGLSKRWNYVCRTTPNIAEQLKTLEHVTREEFIPAILDRIHSCTDELRETFTLPPKFGGLGIPDMTKNADSEYLYSQLATKKLTAALVEQQEIYKEDTTVSKATKSSITLHRRTRNEELKKKILSSMSETGKLTMELASEKGASSWLTALPVQQFGYLLNKQQFTDALCLRYNLTLKDCPKVCACGQDNSVNHALICKLGGYVSMRHNWLRDTFVRLMKSAKCSEVQTEPGLLPVNNYHLPSGTLLGDQARLDISARSVWNVLERAFFDVRVFHAHAPTNASKPVPAMYISHENEKKRMYNARVLQIERGTFTPLVFSTSGGMGKEAERLVKRLAQKMEASSGQRYSDAVSFLRKRLRFELLKTSVIALRGDRGARLRNNFNQNNDIVSDLDLNLEPFG